MTTRPATAPEQNSLDGKQERENEHAANCQTGNLLEPLIRNNELKSSKDDCSNDYEFHYRDQKIKQTRACHFVFSILGLMGYLR